MDPADHSRAKVTRGGDVANRPDACTRGLRRLAFRQTLKDPAAAIFVACAVPALLVVPAAPLIILAAPCALLALWRLKYLDLLASPPPDVCARCLYDLRGLQTVACPECGQDAPRPSAQVNP